MTSDVKEALRLLKEVTGDRKFLFPKRKDSKSSHLAATTFDKNWADGKALAGIKTRLRFHDLRHECASRLGDIGMPHKAACELLDMSIKTFNDIYSKSNMEVKERWIRIMEREY